MGACFGSASQPGQKQINYHQNMVNQMMDAQAQMVGQVASEPRQLANGNLLIPMNYISGEFPTKYPLYLEQYNISQGTYQQFINELNATTMPIYKEQNTLNPIQQIQQNPMDMMMNHQMQIMQIQQKLVINTDALLLKYNQTVFQQYGLQCESSLPSVTMTNTAQIGIIIKQIQKQQIVYVVQQQQPPSYEGNVENQDEELPQHEGQDPPQYTNQ